MKIECCVRGEEARLETWREMCFRLGIGWYEGCVVSSVFHGVRVFYRFLIVNGLKGTTFNPSNFFLWPKRVGLKERSAKLRR